MSKDPKITLIQVGLAQEIFHARRIGGRGWYMREYHSPAAMEMFKAGEMGKETYLDFGPFATKERATRYARRRRAGADPITPSP